MFKFRFNSLFLAVLLGTVSLFTAYAGGQKEPEKEALALVKADVLDPSQIRARFNGLPESLEGVTFTIEPQVEVVSQEHNQQTVIFKLSKPLSTGVDYIVTVSIPEEGATASAKLDVENLNEMIWNEMYSDKEMGYVFAGGKSTFRVFVPRGKVVKLHIFNKFDDEKSTEYTMTNDGNQVFEHTLDGPLWGKFYGYQITERTATPKAFTPSVALDTIFADPYSKALATKNEYPQKGRTLIINTDGFNWQGVNGPGYDISDLVIMEAHVRDLTASPTAGTSNPGTFKGLLNAKNGGLAHLKKLGINALEFLPIQDFNNVEAPFGERAFGIVNKWNTYSQNYWGYMTTNFFTPESYYATDGTMTPGKWNGTDGRVVTEFKETVRELHRNGISVILDVVYNHVSGYDEQPLKIIDMDFFFKKNDKTGTGNEVETRRKMVRKMVLDSLKYWMKEYKIDGFRFDLAASHDKVTVQAIYDELRAINPKIYLIAEPWGGEGATSAADFIRIGWSKWNSGIRDVIRSENRPAKTGRAFPLGNGGASRLTPYWKGNADGKAYQMVNYIESHDDATFGDILRILSGFYSHLQADGKTINRIDDLEAYQKLTPELLNAHRVAAGALFLAQGPVMLHIGQEWARGKVVPDLTGKVEEVTNKGKIGTSSDNVVFRTPTPNTYSADNEVNWINFDHVKLNQDLMDYYSGLIRLRISEPLLGKATPDQVTVLKGSATGDNSLGTNIAGKIFGFVNSDKSQDSTFDVPEGEYSVLVDKTKAGTTELAVIQGPKITVPSSSVLILRKK